MSFGETPLAIGNFPSNVSDYANSRLRGDLVLRPGKLRATANQGPVDAGRYSDAWSGVDLSIESESDETITDVIPLIDDQIVAAKPRRHATGKLVCKAGIDCNLTGGHIELFLFVSSSRIAAAKLVVETSELIRVFGDFLSFDDGAVSCNSPRHEKTPRGRGGLRAFSGADQW